MRTRVLASLLGAVALVLALSACGGDDDDAGSEPGVTITEAWARTSPMSAENGAAYMLLEAATDDALVAVEVDASIAAEAQIHETVMAEGGMSDTTMGDMSDTTMGDSSDTTMGGMGEMTMQEVDRIDLPAGESVALEPGGYHVMLMGLAEPLAAGQSFQLTLSFEQAGEQVVDVTVRDG